MRFQFKNNEDVAVSLPLTLSIPLGLIEDIYIGCINNPYDIQHADHILDDLRAITKIHQGSLKSILATIPLEQLRAAKNLYNTMFILEVICQFHNYLMMFSRVPPLSIKATPLPHAASFGQVGVDYSFRPERRKKPPF